MSETTENAKDEILSELMTLVQSLKQDNEALRKKQEETDNVVQRLTEELSDMKHTLLSQEERHATVLAQLNNRTEVTPSTQPPEELSTTTEQAPVTPPPVKRSVPAPSKFMEAEQKKKDNRLLELRRITKEFMKVDDEEAGLRLYKLQKTMVHVVADLKKYMKSKDEDITKSWKSIDLNTQRVAFEMVEREATSLGVPLNRCIGYWGARRLISKSWANALRTTKKNTKPTNPEEGNEDEENRQSKKIKT